MLLVGSHTYLHIDNNSVLDGLTFPLEEQTQKLEILLRCGEATQLIHVLHYILVANLATVLWKLSTL